MIVPAPVTNAGSYAKTASTSPPGRGCNDDLAAEPVEELAEGRVLPFEERRIGLAPAGSGEVALR